MQTDYLIVGQGISGSILYHALTSAGADCIMIDESSPNAASKVAGGLVNPVTGRRIVKSWMIDELLPALRNTYQQLEKDLNIRCLYEKSLSWFLPAIDLIQSFDKKISVGTDYLEEEQSSKFSDYFNFPFKVGRVRPCYVLDMQLLLTTIRKKIAGEGRYRNEKFEYERTVIADDGIEYKDLHCRKIIFCEGSEAIQNPWFNKLPYSLNKGEALILHIPDLPREQIYKSKQTLVPVERTENLWWYGSNYEWEFENDLPTAAYRAACEKELRSLLKVPFRVEDHKAAIRYATVERRPFIGVHPFNKNIAIFNGWGTKACSLVPWFANHFKDHLLNDQLLLPEVNVLRYKNLLTPV